MAKSAEAFRTISEVADWLGVQTHVLRFWESKFTQVKPLKRAGGRRYYRPADMLLLGGIKKLLHEDGMTIKGAQKILREQGIKAVVAMCPLEVDGEGAEDIAPVVAPPASAAPQERSQSETAPLPQVEASDSAPEFNFSETSAAGPVGTETPPVADVAPEVETPAEPEPAPVEPASAAAPDPQVDLPSFMRRTAPTPGLGGQPVAPTAPPTASQPSLAGLPLPEALAQMRPGQLDAAKLLPIVQKMRDLAARMDG